MVLAFPLPGASIVTISRPTRRRRSTVDTMDGCSAAQGVSARFAGYSEEAPTDGFDTSGSSSGSNEIHGRIGEGEGGVRFVEVGRRRSKRSLKTHAHTVQTRSRSVGDWTNLELKREGKRREHSLFEVDVDYSAEVLLEESSSARNSTSSSVQSSPSSSECESDGKGAEGWSARVPWNQQCPLSLPLDLLPLSRRHTVPARKRLRSASLSLTLITSPTNAADIFLHQQSPAEPPTPSILSGILPPLTFTAATLTALIFLLKSTSLRIIPSSPAHLLRASNNSALEYLNAVLSPFAITSSTSSVILALVNLSLLRNIELAEAPLGERLQCHVVGIIWTSIIAVRLTLAWVFGRVLGWAHPSLFSTPAVHEVGSGKLAQLTGCLVPELIGFHQVLHHYSCQCRYCEPLEAIPLRPNYHKLRFLLPTSRHRLTTEGQEYGGEQVQLSSGYSPPSFL